MLEHMEDVLNSIRREKGVQIKRQTQVPSRQRPSNNNNENEGCLFETKLDPVCLFTAGSLVCQISLYDTRNTGV